MKFLVILSVFLLAANVSAGANPAAVEKAAAKCREGSAITKEMIENLFNGKTMGEPEYSMKCYFKCLLHELGLMKTDGPFELDANHAHFGDCAQKAMEDDLCERAYDFHKCIHTQFPELPVF